MIIKTVKSNKFLNLANHTVRDRRLSLDTSGFLHHILSYSREFEASIQTFMDMFKIGRDKLLRITNELKEFGYLQLVPTKNKKGNFDGWEWRFYDESQGIDFRNLDKPEVRVSGDTDNTDVRETRTSGNTDDIKKNEEGLKKDLKGKEKLEREKEKTHTDSQFKTCEETEKSEEKFVCVSKPQNSIPVQDSSQRNQSNDEIAFEQTILARITKRLDLKILPPMAIVDWRIAAEFAFKNDFSPEKFLECYDTLSNQEWRKGRVSPKNVMENLATFDKGKQNDSSIKPQSDRKQRLKELAEYEASLPNKT